MRRAISLVRAKNIGSVRLNFQPECIQTIIMAWGFRRYTYGTGKTHVRYGNCISFLQFPPRSQGSVDAKRRRVMDSYGTLWQFAWQDTSSRAETSFKSLQFSRTSICGLKASKMACCAIRRMPCGKSLISTPSYPVPSVFSHTQRVALQQRSVAKVCLQTKGRLARNPWTFDEKIRNIDWKHWEFTDSPDSRWEKGWNLY